MMNDNLSFYESTPNTAPVRIVAVPMELGSDERGLAQAPQYLLSCGLEKMIASIGRSVAGKSAVPCPKESRIASAGRMKHAEQIAAVDAGVKMIVEQSLRRGEVALTLGGDHSIAIGSIAGAAAVYPSLGVIYIDAHPDCNTNETTITGNVHGMVTSALMGYGHPLLAGIARRAVPRNRFLYAGLKDIDQTEMDFLRNNALNAFTMLDIASRGLGQLFAEISRMAQSVDAVWVSMDMDSIDEEHAPGVGMPNQGGFTRREITSLAHYIGKTCEVVGIDLVEMHPAKDRGRKTAKLAIELAARFMGGDHSWYEQQYMRSYREINITKGEAKALKRVRGKVA